MKWDVNYKVIPFAWLKVIFLQPQGYNKPQLLGKKIIYFQKSQSDNKDPKLNYQHHRRRRTTGGFEEGTHELAVGMGGDGCERWVQVESYPTPPLLLLRTVPLKRERKVTMFYKDMAPKHMAK
jgi:hypothetical protein